MSDFKSKLPDLKELGDITGKLFKDIKNSVTEIIEEYKQKRETEKKTAVHPNASKAQTGSVKPKPDIIKPKATSTRTTTKTAPKKTKPNNTAKKASESDFNDSK